MKEGARKGALFRAGSNVSPTCPQNKKTALRRLSYFSVKY